MASSLGFLFDLALLPMLLLVLAGRFGAQAWLLEMTNYFRPHIAALALLFLLLALLTGSRPRIAAAVFVFAAALWPLLVTSLPKAASATEGNFRLMTANVLRSNRDFEAFRRVVSDASPDVVVMQEATAAWRPTATSLPGLSYVTPPDAMSTVTVASRFPIRSAPVELDPDATPSLQTGGARAVRVEIDRPGAARPLVLYAVHAPTTRRAAGWEARNAYLAAIAERVRGEAVGTDVIMAGDWNTAFWSPTLASVLAVSGLATTEPGAWPPPTRFFREAGLPPVLGTPIDRITVSKRIGLASIAVGSDFGSDHLPVTAALAIP